MALSALRYKDAISSASEAKLRAGLSEALEELMVMSEELEVAHRELAATHRKLAGADQCGDPAAAGVAAAALLCRARAR